MLSVASPGKPIENATSGTGGLDGADQARPWDMMRSVSTGLAIAHGFGSRVITVDIDSVMRMIACVRADTSTSAI
jgi:ABC-type phosphonate transport system ATPase subunit